MDLKTRTHVRVITSGGGWFDGEVIQINYVHQRPTQARIQPDSIDVQRYLGGEPYRLGVAHWDSRLIPLVEIDTEGEDD